MQRCVTLIIGLGIGGITPAFLLTVPSYLFSEVKVPGSAIAAALVAAVALALVIANRAQRVRRSGSLLMRLVLESFFACLIVGEIVLVAFVLETGPPEIEPVFYSLPLLFLVAPYLLLSAVLFAAAMFIPSRAALQGASPPSDRRMRTVLVLWLMVMTALGITGTADTQWIAAPVVSAIAGLAWIHFDT